MKTLIIHTDGGARGNPGPAAIGVVIKTETGLIIEKLSRTIGETTNNVAEYTAVLDALTYLKKSKHNIEIDTDTYVKFFMDSTLVANQLSGLYKVKDAKLRDILLQVRIIEQEIGGRITYSYVPREQNTEADFLVNKAFDG
jgi:ribonuclease HI